MSSSKYPNAPFCGTCGKSMLPLWGAKWFCEAECDLPPEQRTRRKVKLSEIGKDISDLWTDLFDFGDEEPTKPTRSPPVPAAPQTPSPSGTGYPFTNCACGGHLSPFNYTMPSGHKFVVSCDDCGTPYPRQAVP